ncbi:unnamed protein product [Prunus brigantina]
MARTMMHEKKIPLKFWAEAVNTAVYLQNRSPTSALDNTTPFEKFSGRKPGVMEFFEKGYRVFNLRTQKIELSRSVIFYEKAMWDWESNEAVQVEVTIPWNDEQSSMTSEFDLEASDSPQSVQSPLRTQVVSDLQATTDSIPPDSSVSTSETYNDTPRKWKSLDDVYAQCKMSIIEPENFTEVVKDEAWKKAMTEEMLMIEKNSTWELVDRPSNKPIVGAKLDTIRTLIALAAQKGWNLWQLDVK